MVSLLDQINRERRKRGWSVQRLLDESKLKIDRSVLHRKLTEETAISADEIETLAQALELTLVWTPDEVAS